MLNNVYSCDLLILGKLTRETIINRNKEIFVDQPGGNLLYTAYGYTLWGKTARLISRIGCDYPDEWVEEIQNNSLNTLGISKNLNNSDSSSFFMVDENNKVIENNPRKYFSEHNMPLPKSLLGYEASLLNIDNRKQGSDFTIRPENIPEEYFESRYLAFCPVDFLTHNMIPAFFRSRTGGEVFIHASQGYSHSSFFYDFPPLVNGSSLLLISEENAKKLFLGKLDDTWLIAEMLASYGVEIIIISRITGGYDIFENGNKKKYHIPSYRVNCIDPIGVDDAFFGGFLAGYLKHFDPIYASIIGSVTASVKNEGSTPGYLLGAFHELLQARVDFLKENIESI
jgi:sugar/nucleoside kinase (ribokinase family)